jgi:hypothetical protein
LATYVPEFEMRHEFSPSPSDVLHTILEELRIPFNDYMEIFTEAHHLFAMLVHCKIKKQALIY